MQPSLRKAYNEAFTQERYKSFLDELNSKYPGAIEFRIAETPVFIPKEFGSKILNACESIIDLITDPMFQTITDASIPPNEKVPGNEGVANMIAFDFAVCYNSAGEPEPQLVEMQGFPSLYGFQVDYPDLIPRYFPVPDNYHQYLGRHDRSSYIEQLRTVILKDHPPESVILLDIQPHRQKTRIDFYCTRDLLAIVPVCITELIREGKYLGIRSG